MRTTITFLLCLIVLATDVAGTVAGETLTVIAFNVESDDDTIPARVAEDIAAIAEDGIDVWDLTEVEDKQAANIFRQAAAREAKVRYVLGTHGREDRLAILYNLDTLKVLGHEELTNLPGSRKPLVARFRHKASRVEFVFVVNHFNRGDASRRQRQAERLLKWSNKQPLPVILVGDYNFDFDPQRGTGNRAFEIFMQGQALRWIESECIATGNCPGTGTQCDGRFNSILDFVFTAGPARDWEGFSEILFPERAYCNRDRSGHADHRPVLALFELPSR